MRALTTAPGSPRLGPLSSVRALTTTRIPLLPPSPAPRYAPDNTWYIRTMNAVFELGGELVRPDIAHNLMRLIAEGSGEDEAADMAMRKYAASQYYELLEKPVLPDNLVQVLCWVLGEYGYLVDGTQVLDIATRLCGVIKRQLTHVSTRNWVLGALVKLVAQLGQAPSQVTASSRWPLIA